MFGKRLNQLQGKANQTMNAAQATLGAFQALADELTDGVNFKIVRKGDASIMDFVMGKVDELPFQIRVEPQEETDGVKQQS